MDLCELLAKGDDLTGLFGGEMWGGKRPLSTHSAQIRHKHRKKVYTSRRFVHCSLATYPLR